MNGADISVIRITGSGSGSGGAVKPRVAVVSGSHGNEAVTTEISIALVTYLLRKYKSDTVIAQVRTPVRVPVSTLLMAGGIMLLVYISL
mgnify:FL=1